MRLFTYELLTQAILFTAWLRKRIMLYQPEQVRIDRVFDVYSLETWACCDCGLEHRFRSFNDPGAMPCDHIPYQDMLIIGHAWPIRPKGYKYKQRLTAERPSLAVNKETLK